MSYNSKDVSKNVSYDNINSDVVDLEVDYLLDRFSSRIWESQDEIFDGMVLRVIKWVIFCICILHIRQTNFNTYKSVRTDKIY